jgi:POT family proton-dependent oligopeptide transporter
MNLPQDFGDASQIAVPSIRHPRGLYALFFTEMWERFSYYGMRALLVLFMVDAINTGGMGLTDKIATSIYGLYTATVYLMSLPGGWLADRILGSQRAVWWGGIIIAIGHFTLAIPQVQTFYLGLVLVAIGSGILKPNMSVMVADLYPEGGARRDAGFTIFYMGVNLGAAIGPLICGLLAKHLGWHYGFGAAGVGMVLGLIQFRFSRHLLGDAGRDRGNPADLHPFEGAGLICAIVALVLVAGLGMAGILHFNPVALAQYMAYLLLAISVFFFAWLFLFAGLDTLEKERVAIILVLFLTSAIFWAGFEQAGSSFNLFAERFTNRAVPGFKHDIPSAWFQACGPVFIIAFAPVFAALWVRLARRNLDPSIPVKFAFGLLLLAAGFVVMAGASRIVAAGYHAAPFWLISTFLIHTFGELCLSPVGLSSVTKLAPKRLVGQLMGTWFLATSLGNLLAGLLAGEFKTDALLQWPVLYMKITILPTIAGVLLIAGARPMKKWMGDVK